MRSRRLFGALIVAAIVSANAAFADVAPAPAPTPVPAPVPAAADLNPSAPLAADYHRSASQRHGHTHSHTYTLSHTHSHSHARNEHRHVRKEGAKSVDESSLSAAYVWTNGGSDGMVLEDSTPQTVGEIWGKLEALFGPQKVDGVNGRQSRAQASKGEESKGDEVGLGMGVEKRREKFTPYTVVVPVSADSLSATAFKRSAPANGSLYLYHQVVYETASETVPESLLHRVDEAVRGEAESLRLRLHGGGVSRASDDGSEIVPSAKSKPFFSWPFGNVFGGNATNSDSAIDDEGQDDVDPSVINLALNPGMSDPHRDRDSDHEGDSEAWEAFFEEVEMKRAEASAGGHTSLTVLAEGEHCHKRAGKKGRRGKDCVDFDFRKGTIDEAIAQLPHSRYFLIAFDAEVPLLGDANPVDIGTNVTRDSAANSMENLHQKLRKFTAHSEHDLIVLFAFKAPSPAKDHSKVIASRMAHSSMRGRRESGMDHSTDHCMGEKGEKGKTGEKADQKRSHREECEEGKDGTKCTAGNAPPLDQALLPPRLPLVPHTQAHTHTHTHTPTHTPYPTSETANSSTDSVEFTEASRTSPELSVASQSTATAKSSPASNASSIASNASTPASSSSSTQTQDSSVTVVTRPEKETVSTPRLRRLQAVHAPSHRVLKPQTRQPKAINSRRQILMIKHTHVSMVLFGLSFAFASLVAVLCLYKIDTPAMYLEVAPPVNKEL